MIRNLLLLLMVFQFGFLFSQTVKERNEISLKSNVERLKENALKSAADFKTNKEKALGMAKKNGWVIREEKNGVLIELMKLSADGKPIYYTTYNVNAAKSTRANTLHTGGLLGLNVNGQGMIAHIWDGGLARSTHQEYDGAGGSNRFSIGDGTTALSDHSGHVTGTIIASGFTASAKGMAPQAYAVGYDWNSDLSEAGTAAAGGMLISNHSYGYGAPDIPDSWFGQYGQDAVDWDELMFNAPYYLMVVAAGNDGNDNSSNAAPLDGNSSYDKLSGHTICKNNMVVANGNDASIDASGNLLSVTINSSSSEGPTDDYRIKPDITGNGTTLYSSITTGDNRYDTYTGTSMASPNVTGTLLILQQYYNLLNSNYMRAATLKGLALHTADDAGTVGPDAIFGWGLMNAKFAAQTITNKGNSALIDEMVLNNGSSSTFTVTSDGTNPLIVSISWTDPAGELNTNTNDHTPVLVNDLDVRVTKGGTTYYPYRLTSITTNGTGDNTVDPFEKIIVTGASGDYTISINHKGTLTNGSQNYSVIVTGITLAAPSIASVSSSILYEDRGKQLTINGSGLLGCGFALGGISGTVVSNSGTVAVIDFPAGNYSGTGLTASNFKGTATYIMTVSTRNILPVVSGSGVTSDNHPSIQSAIDGLYAWYGSTSFSGGDLAGSKTIDIYSGTYSEGVVLNADFLPTSTNPLIIQNHATDEVFIDATGLANGFDLNTVDYVHLTGLNVFGAQYNNILISGSYNEVSYVKSYTAGSAGLRITTGVSNVVSNNILYNNLFGIIVSGSNTNTFKNNTLYNNGGIVSGTAVNLYSQGFNTSGTTVDPTGWDTEILINPSGVVPSITYITTSVAGEYPICTPSEGTRMVKFDAWNSEAGDEARLYQTLPISTIGYQDIRVTFDWYDDSYQYSATEGAIVQWSTDGSTWNDVEFIPRYAPVSAWSNKSVLLPTAANNQAAVYIAFRFHSEYLDNSHLDNLIITGCPPVNTGAGISVESGTGTTIQNNIFVAKAGNNNYYALQSSTGISVSSSYNTYYTTNTNLFNYNGTIGNTGPIGTGDITTDPQFVNAPSDFHLKSAGGSYAGGTWPPITAIGGSWTNDATTSPAIDAGNTADAYANEPEDNGNRINQGAYGNTAQASKSAIATVTIAWDGTAGTDWQTLANWTPEQIPTASENVTIPLGCSNYPVINNGIGTPALCNNLTISGGSVTIAPGGYMTVAGSITNSVGVSGLVIQSTDAGTGSLIQNSTSDVNATVQCRLSSISRQWHMVSAPVTTAAFTVFPSQNSLYDYNEGTDDYWTGTVYNAGSVSGWTAPSGNMVVGKGYSFNYFASTLTYTGILNNNTSTNAIVVPYNDHGLTAGNGANYDNFDGWNLIGNPYTSAIDWDNASVLHGAANLLDAVYTYDDKTLHNYTSYVGGIGTNGGSRYIPAMQGFFVKGAAAGGTLNIGAGARVHNAQSYWKGYNETPENFIRLEVSGNGYKDETVVRMLEGATEDLDNGMDAYKFFTMHTLVPQIYSRTSGDMDYSINTIPNLDEGSLSVPIRLVQTGESYTIRVSEFNFSDIKVYLKDNLYSKTTEIGLEDLILLTADASDASNRFELLFEKTGSSSVVIADQVKAVIYPNPNTGSFYVTVSNGVNGYEMEVSTITGQLIYKNTFEDNYTKEIKLNAVNAGVYFVKIRFADGSELNKKIIVND